MLCDEQRSQSQCEMRPIREQLADLQSDTIGLKARAEAARAAQAQAEADAARSRDEILGLRAEHATELAAARKSRAEEIRVLEEESQTWRRRARELQQQLELTSAQRWGGVQAMADGSRRAAVAAPSAPLTPAELSMLAELAQRGEEWLRRNWWPALGPLHRVDPNPGLSAGCPAVRRFLRGLSQLSLSQGGGVAVQRRLLSQGCWGLRSLPGGTVEERSDALGVVCHWGWGHPASRDAEMLLDVTGSARRRGPPNESAHCLAAGVGDGGERAFAPQLLSFVLRGSHYRLVEGAAHAVTNPRDGSATYDLPVLAVAYGDCMARPRFAQLRWEGD